MPERPMDTPSVRLAIIGCGYAAREIHLPYVTGLANARLAAIVDRDLDRARRAASPHGARAFDDLGAMVDAGVADAAIVAVPHPMHAGVCRELLVAGLHVLCEKPLAIDAGDARSALRAAGDGLHLGLMLNQRTWPAHVEIKRCLAAGELGPIRRLQWTITDWFRTQAYYDQSSWRGTWAGEGGGVLVNQAPHQLDLLCWWLRRPALVHAHLGLGRRHDIEAEDEVSAFLEWPGEDAPTGVFITSTGESPGINRLEIIGDRGRLELLGGTDLTTWTVEGSTDDFLRTDPRPMAEPAHQVRREAFDKPTDEHATLTQNFIEAIRGEAELLVPASEGVAAIELANAMVVSGMSDQPCPVPPPAGVFGETLRRLARDREIE